ncbi:hypothetical protein F0L68_33610 [Solihabitans fulvus]|uniref:Uncharacterized protein n=1 Tax=Solihabitans fulvus TaxID=1892852 RepID=A0A5B2WQP0_9PSEU|nr:hypothetical protein [Solihabitans fulvus]KAA2253100.1 hypothetical protein F0L68_33610 [Solihabitans fulvus]
MEYLIVAEVNIPEGAPELDALQRHGAAALLEEHLDLLAGIEGPDGIEIDTLGHHIAVHPSGAFIGWRLDAPALAFAEDAARHILPELLERTELLADWHLQRCAATATDAELATALEPEPELLDPAEGDGISQEDLAALRSQLLADAEHLHAFGPEAFGHDPDDPDCDVTAEQARFVAGALIQGVQMLTDELLADIQTLRHTNTPASEHDTLWVIDELPPRYAHRYTALFAQKFLIATTVLGYRLPQPGWLPPLCTAEALALRLLEDKIEVVLETSDLLDELPLEEMLAALNDHLFEDLDHEWLYDPEHDGIEDDPDLRDQLGLHNLAITEWFLPHTHLASALHPHLIHPIPDVNSPD